jgi:putative FmdB family regulatory protein
MPVYDYKCKSCGQTTELNRKISARDETTEITCTNCSTTGCFERLVAAPLVGYSVTVNGGYGSHVPDGFKDVLRKIDQRSPGSRMKETSAFL